MTKKELLAQAEDLAIEASADMTNAEIKALIDEHSVSEQSDSKNPLIVSVGSDQYEFKVKSFRFKGNHYTAEAAVDNSALVKELIKSNYPQLKKI